MALIEFKDLPDTTTPLTAANLNNNFNECYKADSGWQDMTLINNWGTYTQNYQKAQYRKIGNQVFLRGMIISGSNNTYATVLPEGYRPAFNIYAPAVDDNGANFVRIYPDGNIKVYSYTNWLSLTGISFFVD